MNRMPSDLKGVTWFICNQDEAETYTGHSISNEADWKKAVHELLAFGAENVVVTAGSQGESWLRLPVKRRFTFLQ